MRNPSRLADVYANLALACNKTAAIATALSIYVTVTTAGTSSLASGRKSVAARFEVSKHTEWPARVRYFSASLKDDGKDAWKSDFELRAFDLDTYGGLRDEALPPVQFFAE